MPNTLSVVSIGAGNVAHHLIPALAGISCHILQIYSRNIHHARSLADMVDAKSVDKLEKITGDAELYLIMVPDDDIQQVVTQLPKLKNNAVIAHTAGAKSIRILKGKSYNYGSFYPLQSFKKLVGTDLSQTPFLVDGNNEFTIRTLRALARKLSPDVKHCGDEDRLYYHLAAVFINNFINHLSCISGEILKQKGLDPRTLHAISQSTFEKALEENPCEIQTGPAARNDLHLQRKHLALLKEHPEWSEIYKAISVSIKSMYHENS